MLTKNHLRHSQTQILLQVNDSRSPLFNPCMFVFNLIPLYYTLELKLPRAQSILKHNRFRANALARSSYPNGFPPEGKEGVFKGIAEANGLPKL